MGLQLECPLCCSETFSSHNSLKYHLLSVIDNLICTSCQKRFDNVLELAMHLGRSCDNDDDSQLSCNGNSCEDIKNENDIEFVSCKSISLECIRSVEKPPEVAVDLRSEGHGSTERDENLSSLGDTGLSSGEELNNEDEDQYYCSTCDVNLESVDDHIEQFHADEEVLVEKDIDYEKIEIDPVNSNTTDEEEEQTDTTNLNDLNKTAKLLDTIQEEDCTDKAGRLYVRKVVKIEKFWNDTRTDVPPLSFDLSSNGSISERFEKVIECPRCEIKLESLDKYQKHRCGKNVRTCGNCDASFTNLKALKSHMRVHRKKKKKKLTVSDMVPLPYICEMCNTEFDTAKSLRLHRRMHDPVKSKDIEPPATYGIVGASVDTPRKMFVCQICNKTYDKQYEEAHKNFHSKDKNLNCVVCNRKFNTRENLDMHMSVHTEVKKFYCPNCKKGFLTERKLSDHNPAECEKRPFECQYCGRCFARPHEKVKHERIHTGEKPHVCPICGKAFRIGYCLTLHMRTHSGTRPYLCKVCGKRFKAQSVFSHHLQTHSTDRNYKCPFCPKSFKTGVQLAGHKNSHTKPFNCPKCNRPFASLYAVRAHLETHERRNNLKFNCFLCGASYARLFALRDHCKELHGGQIDPNQDLDSLLLEAQEYEIETEENV